MVRREFVLSGEGIEVRQPVSAREFVSAWSMGAPCPKQVRNLVPSWGLVRAREVGRAGDDLAR